MLSVADLSVIAVTTTGAVFLVKVTWLSVLVLAAVLGFPARSVTALALILGIAVPA